MSESRAELAARQFSPPAVYSPPRSRFVLELVAAWLAPAASLTMAGAVPEVARWLVPATVAVALAVTVYVAGWRSPGRLVVKVGPLGLDVGGRAIPWSRVVKVVQCDIPRAGRGEPSALTIEVAGGPPVVIRRGWARGAGIASLRNLADLLGQVTREEEAAHNGESSVGEVKG